MLALKKGKRQPKPKKVNRLNMEKNYAKKVFAFSFPLFLYIQYVFLLTVCFFYPQMKQYLLSAKYLHYAILKGIIYTEINMPIIATWC